MAEKMALSSMLGGAPTSFVPEPDLPEAGAEPSVVDMATEVLSPEDAGILNQVIDAYPEMIGILDTLAMSVSQKGPISGPGDGTSDSVPAKLSDGEFVFTSKAVKQLGVDKLRKMMKKAEQDFDEAQGMQDMASASPEGFACGGFVSRH